MRNYLIVFLLIFIGCKTTNDLNHIETLSTTNYELKYPKNWKKTKLKRHTKYNSLVIGKLSGSTFLSNFTVLLNMYKTELDLKDLIGELIEKDELIIKDNILLIKNKEDYVQINYKVTYPKRPNSPYLKFTRYYKKRGIISKATFSVRKNKQEKYLKFKELFFDSFKLK